MRQSSRKESVDAALPRDACEITMSVRAWTGDNRVGKRSAAVWVWNCEGANHVPRFVFETVRDPADSSGPARATAGGDQAESCI